MNIEKYLDKIHCQVVKNRFLQLFTAFTRLLLGIGFIFPSIPKIMNQPFTSLPDSNPVGHYFNALYQTGYYYQFIGWSQLLAVILLIIPRTSHLGALMFLPIIINIAVLTNSVGFKGTWLITIFMALASLYLVCWDYDRWKTILFSKRLQNAKLLKHEFIWLPILFVVGAVSSYLFLALFLLNNFSRINAKFILILMTASFVFGLSVALHHKFMRIGDLKIPNETL